MVHGVQPKVLPRSPPCLLPRYFLHFQIVREVLVEVEALDQPVATPKPSHLEDDADADKAGERATQVEVDYERSAGKAKEDARPLTTVEEVTALVRNPLELVLRMVKHQRYGPPRPYHCRHAVGLTCG